ncbi:MAG: ROK family protein [Acidimicrobiia bacterium]
MLEAPRPRRLLGLDLGGTNIKTAVVEVDTAGAGPRVVHMQSGPTEADMGPDHVAARLVRMGLETIEQAGPVESAGVGVPGLFDYGTGEIVFFTNLPGPWEGYPLRTRLAEGVDTAVTLINDARAFTLAEATVGAGRGCRTLACLTLGTGVGGGLMIEGRLHFGAFGLAGEIGHQTIVPDGPVCGCGSPGCLEAITRPPVVAKAAGRDTFEDVLAGLDEGDPACVAAVDAAVGHLAIGIANIFTVIGPEMVVIGGGVAGAGDLLLEPLRDAVRARLTLIPPEGVRIVASELGPMAGAVGAALASQGSLVGDADFLVGEIPSATIRRAQT